MTPLPRALERLGWRGAESCLETVSIKSSCREDMALLPGDHESNQLPLLLEEEEIHA